MEPMRCEEAMSAMIDLIGHEIEPGARRMLEGHLAVCEACRTEFAAMSGARDAVAGAAGSAADARAATTGLRAPFVAPATARASGWFAAAAGVLLAFGAGYWIRGAAVGTGPAPSPPVAQAETLATSFARVSASSPNVSALGRAMLSLAQR